VGGATEEHMTPSTGLVVRANKMRCASAQRRARCAAHNGVTGPVTYPEPNGSLLVSPDGGKSAKA
jgi:hypothetical protein